MKLYLDNLCKKRVIGWSVATYFATLLLLSSACYSLISNVNDYLIVGKWFGTLFAGIFFILFSLILRSRNIDVEYSRIIPISMVIMNGVISMHTFMQSISLLPNPTNFSGVAGYDNPAGVSATLVVTLPYILMLTKDIKDYIFAAILLLVNIVVLFIIGSRGGLLTLLSISMLYFCLSNKNRRINRCLIMILVFAFVALIYLLSIKKEASTHGRYHILMIVWDMFKDAPLIGHGYEGFATNYMIYQSEYMKGCSAAIRMLADNVNHPLCEYAIIAVNYGVVGLIIVLSIAISLIIHLFKTFNRFSEITLLIVVGVIIQGFISYPFRYPITTISLIISFVLHTASNIKNKNREAVINVAKYVLPFISLYSVFCYTIQVQWYSISSVSASKMENAIRMSKYETLARSLGNNEYFLYNWAVELSLCGNYAKADSIMLICEKHRLDYNTTLLRGDILVELNRPVEADSCYRLCSEMVPSKFIPLYRLFNLYKQTNNVIMQKQIGEEILNKPIKVNSKEVRSIRLRVRQEMFNLDCNSN